MDPAESTYSVTVTYDLLAVGLVTINISTDGGTTGTGDALIATPVYRAYGVQHPADVVSGMVRVNTAAVTDRRLSGVETVYSGFDQDISVSFMGTSPAGAVVEFTRILGGRKSL